MEDTWNEVCYLCKEPVCEDDYCYGCKQFICFNHPESMTKPHEPEFHYGFDSDEEMIDDDQRR